MKRLFRFAVALAFSGAAQAQTWVSVGQSAAGEMFIDVSSIRAHTGGQFKAWSKFIHKEEQTTNGYPAVKYKMVTTQDYYDCKAESFAVKQRHLYADEDAGNSVNGFSVPDSQLRYDDPVPGTLGHVLMRRVCGNRR